jgi:murein DD-endopeptidase MepM/ murein hydrolase activator NlpD
MPALPSARTSRIRRLVSGGALLVACLSLLPNAAAFAESAAPPAPISVARTQRPIAEDFSIDQHLVAQLPAPKPVAAAVPSAPPAKEEEPEMQIASLGPAMRPLVAQFNAIWPTRGEITTYFGEVGPYSPRGHAGIDVAAPQGTPVLAMDQGEVLKAYWNEDGYGGLVIIGHPSGYETWYGHLSRFSVEKGEIVKRGERIGSMGSTGYSTGSHLHFEVRQEGQLLDPLNFLREANLQNADW